jgi:hypothetical protein
VAVLVHWLAMSMPYPTAKLVASMVTFVLWSYPAQCWLVFVDAAGNAHYVAATPDSSPFDPDDP